MDNNVGVKSSERANFDEGRAAANMGESLVDQIKVAAIEHPGIREAKPFYVIVGDIGFEGGQFDK